MNSLFPLPLYLYLKIALRNGGFSGKGLTHTPPWLLKTILFEPLRWMELATQSKKIETHNISKSPIFILGFYRSGTTYLQQLFMQDDRFGFTSGFQMLFPEIMLSCEKWLTPPLESFSRLIKIQNPVHRIPFTLNSPGEEDVAMTTSLSTRCAQWGYFFPGKMKEYFDKYVFFEKISPHEFDEWKKTYMTLLKKISLANHNKQLVLKNPPNTARIKLLLSLYPEARFIHILRNPYEVYASNKNLWQTIHTHFSLNHPENIDVSEIILSIYSGVMNRYIGDRNLIPSSRLIELRYEEFINSPVESMQNIYASLNLEDFNYCRNKVIDYAESQKKYATLKHNLHDRERKIISEKWGSIINELGYQVL